jgi:pyrroline-5-carboxylate reductase
VSNEDEFDTVCAATGTVAAFLAFMGGVVAWLAARGVPERQARDYVARMFGGATSEAAGYPQRSFQSLARVHATVGGINELFLRYLVERGLLENVSDGLDAIENRIKETAAGHQ